MAETGNFLITYEYDKEKSDLVESFEPGSNSADFVFRMMRVLHTQVIGGKSLSGEMLTSAIKSNRLSSGDMMVLMTMGLHGVVKVYEDSLKNSETNLEI